MPQPNYGNITYGPHQNVTASDIAFSIHTSVDSAFYDVEYPEHEWYNVLKDDQVLRDVNPGATTYAYITRDRHGQAAFVGNGPNRNIPRVGQSAGAVTVPVAYAAVGAEITNEDARQYAFGFNANLAQDLGEAMRVACDNLTETTFFFGNADMGFQPFMGYQGIRVTLVAPGKSGNTEMAKKTPLENFQTINNALTQMWKDSRTIFKPDTIYLPPDQFALLSEPMVIGGEGGAGVAMSVIEYAKKHATVPALSGRELVILPLRYLGGQGLGGSDRMIVLDRGRRNQGMPMPMPYTLGQPVPGDLSAKLFAEMKIGSFFVRQPGSIGYFDGI